MSRLAYPIIAPVLVALLLLPDARLFAQSKPTVDKLVATFDDVVFGSEIDTTMRATQIAKWQEPLRVKVEGKPKPNHIEYLQDHLRVILDLTGLTIEKTEGTDGTGHANVTVLFVSESEMANVKIKAPGVTPQLIKTLAGARGCYFLSFKSPPEKIVRSIIVVNNQRTSRAIKHCLLEEVIQSLGLPNDSNLIRPSLFSDLDSVTSFTRSDEILVRAMYDPRLIPGTPRLEALEVVRGIIEELDASIPAP